MQNARLTIPAKDFPALTNAITAFNKRTKAVNAGLRKAKYQTVSRIPVGHAGIYVTVEVRIKDRAKVLWQELSEILDRFQKNAAAKATTNTLKEQAQALAGRPKNQTMAQAAAKARAKAVSRPVQPVSRQWGIWVPCETEEAARAAAGFLAAITKIGVPQVEYRG